jgi:hypothetical protein
MLDSRVNNLLSQDLVDNEARWNVILQGLQAFSLGTDADNATTYDVLKVTASIVYYFLVDSLGYCGGGRADDRKKVWIA